MGVGRGGRGASPLWNLKLFAKKGCFFNFGWKKQISPLLAPLGKFLPTPLVDLTTSTTENVLQNILLSLSVDRVDLVLPC